MRSLLRRGMLDDSQVDELTEAELLVLAGAITPPRPALQQEVHFAARDFQQVFTSPVGGSRMSLRYLVQG